MYWELQNVAAAMIAASTVAAPAATGDLKYSGASALEKWHLTASAARRPWDPTDAMAPSRFDASNILDGESSRASLAFDWQRSLEASRLEAAVFANRSAIELQSGLARLEGSSYGERFEQRDQRSLFGVALRWTGDGGIGAMDEAHSASVRLRTETLDADGAFRVPGGAATQTLRQDRLRQTGATLNFESELQLAARLRSVASVRYDAYRFGVASDLDGHAGSRTGAIASPHVSLIADLSAGSALFVSAGRGYASDDPRGPGVANDPRNGMPIGRLDPLSTMTTSEAGFRAHLAPNLHSSVSLFRARTASEILLDGDTGVGEILRPALRQGIQFSTRYEPAAWITLDLQAAALRARYLDGAGEHVAGAPERTISAATTVRTPNGWSASLLVNSLATRDSPSDDMRVKPSTFVNARLMRDLSRRTRLSVDIFNVFDRRVANLDYFSAARLWAAPGAGDSFLFNPAEPRGFRVKLRTTF